VLQTRAVTHPSRGAAPRWGRVTGGVAALNLRLISVTPTGVDARRLRRLTRGHRADLGNTLKIDTSRPKPASFRKPTPGRTIPEGDFYHSLGLPQRSAGYPRSPSPTHDSTRKELAMEPRRLTDTPPANGCQAVATTDPSGVPEGSRGSSAAPPRSTPPTTPAPRRRCQKSRLNRTNAGAARRPARRPSCASVSVRHPNNPPSGRWLRVAPGDLSWRPFARHTQPQHREYPRVEGICTCPF
jgi:hypothetical protein